MSDQTGDAGPKLHPSLTGGASLGDEERAMKSGKGGMIAGFVVVAVGLLAALLFLMGGDDEARVYRDMGKRLNGLKLEHFDGFWACALQGADLDEIKSNADLSLQIDRRAVQGGARWGQRVRETCMPKLADIETEVDALILPEDLRPAATDMAESAERLRSAWSAFVSYLDDPESEYDSESAAEYIDGIARAWYEFKLAHAALNKTIKGHLQE